MCDPTDLSLPAVLCIHHSHMVSDKFQVRTTGPVHNLTHQPIKGRKRAGGIRFGEMERDSLLSHGTSFLLQVRYSFEGGSLCRMLQCATSYLLKEREKLFTSCTLHV